MSVSASASFSFKSKDQSENDESKVPVVKALKKKPKLGEKEIPAENCLEIKRYYPKILSGYYYIKTECSPKRLRVFCDFSLYKDVVDFYIFKDEMKIPNPDLGYLNIKKYNDVQYHCSRNGLYPIKLEHKDMVERIYQLLILDGYDLSGPNFIPLGHDYSCKNSKCSGIYNSLTSKSTLPINQFFDAEIEPSSNPGDFVGFGLKASPRLINFDVSKIKVSGLICSTNIFQKKSDNDVTKTISCELNTSQNTDIFNKNDVIVRCPKGCDQSQATVFGRGIYHGDSSICKAAIHAGIINGNGGKLKVVMQTPVPQYISSHENGIFTKDKVNDGIKPFIVMKYIPKCPIDKFKDREGKSKSKDKKNKSSFLEFSNSNELSNTAERLLRGLKEENNDVNNETLNLAENNLNSNLLLNNDFVNLNYNYNPNFEIESIKQRFAQKETSELLQNNESSNSSSLSSSSLAGAAGGLLSGMFGGMSGGMSGGMAGNMSGSGSGGAGFDMSGGMMGSAGGALAGSGMASAGGGFGK